MMSWSLLKLWTQRNTRTRRTSRKILSYAANKIDFFFCLPPYEFRRVKRIQSILMDIHDERKNCRKNICMFMFTCFVLVHFGYYSGTVAHMRSWDAIRQIKNSRTCFPALQLDLLKRWVPWDCIHRNTRSNDFTYFRNLSCSLHPNHMEYFFFLRHILFCMSKIYVLWLQFVWSHAAVLLLSFLENLYPFNSHRLLRIICNRKESN